MLRVREPAQEDTLQRILKLLLRIVELLELISVEMPKEEECKHDWEYDRITCRYFCMKCDVYKD